MRRAVGGGSGHRAGRAAKRTKSVKISHYDTAATRGSAVRSPPDSLRDVVVVAWVVALVLAWAAVLAAAATRVPALEAPVRTAVTPLVILVAVLLVEDTDAARLRPGQMVRLRLEERPGEVIEGEVVEVAAREVRKEASGSPAGDLSTLFDGLLPAGQTRPHYQVRVRLNANGMPLAIGGRLACLRHPRGHDRMAAD